MNIYKFGHTSQDTAYIVDNYPWGWTLKTQQRHWIETVKGKGDRHAVQTLNPKTGRWCTVKKSTYSPVMALFIDSESGHLHTMGLGLWHKNEDVQDFKDKVGIENILPDQLHELNRILALNKAMEGVTFTFKATTYEPVSLLDRTPENIAKMEAIEKEQEEHKKNEEKALQYINYIASKEMAKLERGNV